MKPSQSPSVRQILVYDISSQRFGIYSLLIGIPGLGLLLYWLMSGASNYVWIGLAGVLVALFEVARFVQRTRYFQKIYENGETIRITLEDVTQQGDEINVGGPYNYKAKEYFFWTTLQKTGRTKDLAIGNQIWLMIDRDHPENAYVQDLFTPDGIDEIRLPHVPIPAEMENPIPAPDRVLIKKGTRQKKASASTARELPPTRLSIPTGDEESLPRQLIIRDFPGGFLVIGTILLLPGILIYVFMNENREGAIFAMALGLLIILSTLASTLTIVIDKDADCMSIKSVWRRNATLISLDELRDIRVEASESDEGGMTYRLIAVKTNGDVIPFRSWYTSGLSSFEKRAAQLRDFIGIDSR